MPHQLSRRDLDFLLYEWLDVESLTKHRRFAEHSRDTFDAVLDLSAEIAETHFATHNRKADANEPVMRPDGSVEIIAEVKSALGVYFQSGLIAAPFGEDLGGMQLPNVIARASLAFLQAANAGTSSYILLTMANANLLARFGSPEQIDTWLRPMLEGRYFGTMCLSEPDAGSSLADISTKATRASDGTYRIAGTKMWISGGDHQLSENIVHLVLAKIPGGNPGVKGISLFVVPKILPDGRPNDVTLVGLNHKMGNRGTANGFLSFGDSSLSDGDTGGAVGYLVGEEHKGLGYMFHMMNEARIGVGFLATAIGYAGYLLSVDYAKTRRQGRPVGAKAPTATPVLLVEHSDVRRMLLAQKSYVEGALALGLYCARLVDVETGAGSTDEQARAALLLEVLTPIAKSWPAQWCLVANDLAIQIHGGYGYSREFDVEQLYRDNRLNQIHEGTHGIQGLDLLGRKVVMRDGSGLRVLTAEIAATVQRARSLGVPAQHTDTLDNALQALTRVTRRLWDASDITVTLANSSIYLEAAGHVVLGWIWLEQLCAAGQKAGSFYDGKRQAARYFFVHELPKAELQLKLLASLDRTALDADPDWL